MSTLKGEFLVSIGKRLQEERKRVKFNQTDFAALGGIHKKTVIEYEQDRTNPDASFLSAIAAFGADVQYIVIGKRSININEESALYSIRPDQKALLDNYEHCTKEDKDAIKRMAFLAAHAAEQDETQQDEMNFQHKQAS